MSRKNPAVTITIKREMLEWLDDLIKNDIHYADRSHTVMIALTEMRARIEKGAPAPCGETMGVTG